MQEASSFEPTEAEVEKAREQARAIPVGPPPVRLRLDATALPASVIDELKAADRAAPRASPTSCSTCRPRAACASSSSAPSTASPPTNAALRAELDHLLGGAMLDAVAA